MLRLDGSPLSLEEIVGVAEDGESVALSVEALRRVDDARAVVDRIVAEDRVVYGVTTGFGRLADVRIPAEQVGRLQLNLVRSHACGVGAPLSIAETRALMLLRANVLALGFSGARREVVVLLVEMLNRGVHPIVPSRGSVGASGDLAPLAHLALTLIGEGACHGKTLADVGLTPLVLGAKEGLALLNGTQAIGAVGSLAMHRAQRLARLADLAGAMTLEALLGTPVPFDPRIHAARPHPGQIAVAEHLRDLLADSEIRESHRDNDPRVQDAYCLRCMPQVHGAVRGALDHAEAVFRVESGSATDNPLVFADAGHLVSGGNFHAAPLGYALDYAAIALTDLISISERRLDRLVNPDANEGLPPFLAREPGTMSGFMMAHVTVAALLSEAKVLAHPASVDSVPTSGGKEDHVSMGMTAALKLRQLVDLAERALAVELLAAAEGLEFRRPLRPGRGVERGYDAVRALVPEVTEDRPLGPDIERLAANLATLPCG
ncbi:MAG: histidine ammonia-lyase [Fimbriimonadaceae bacterium]|nr:histidine ammonia-lyase [Fimbriimonadaceae bacterium]